MAKAPNSSILKSVSLFRGTVDQEVLAKAKSLIKDPLRSTSATSLYSVTERNKLLQNIVPREKSAAPLLTEGTLGNYISSLTDAIGNTSLDNDKILAMAPEVNQAAELVIPSIISPNDMRYGIISFICDAFKAGIAQDQANAVQEIVENHFNEHLAISDRLQEWIREALYRSGAKVIMTVPSSELDRLFNSPDVLTLSTEAYVTKVNATLDANASVFGIADAFRVSPNEDFAVNDMLRAGVEGAVAEWKSCIPKPEATSESSKVKASAAVGSYDGKIDSAHIKGIADAVLSSEAFQVVDNPDVLKTGQMKRTKAAKQLNKSIAQRYKPTAMVSIDTPDGSAADEVDHPLLVEIPTEACIPLYVPGAPQTHIGYFIALDEKGHPVTITEDNKGGDLHHQLLDSARRSPFDNLFNAYGLKELQASLGSESKAEAMASIYRHVIEYHLRTRLEKAGLADVEPTAMNSIYGHLFSRYLEGRKTRLLFVPPNFITYMTYRYNANGTGRSKLEDIKFILALRITLLIANTMASLNNSIDRKTVELQFSDQAAASGLGDPIKLINQVKNDYIRKNTFGFSINPDQVMQTIAERSVSVKAAGLPGLSGLNVTQDAGSGGGQRTQPDPALMDDIRNLLILGLDVPPSALNSLSENEFSRSVATMSLFFARKISQKQKITVTHLTDFTREYLRYDGILYNKIAAALGMKAPNSDAKSTPDEDVAGIEAHHTEENGPSKDATVAKPELTEELYEKIVMACSAFLPKPNIAPDNAQFDNFRTLVDSVVSAVDQVYGDDLAAGDAEAAEALTVVRAALKSGLLTRALKNMGLGDDLEFPALQDVAGSDILDIRHLLINLKRMIDDVKKNTTPGDKPDSEDNDPAPSGGGWG